MAVQKNLAKRKMKVIDDLFSEKDDKHDVLDHHKVSHLIFDRWLNDSLFMSEMKRRVRWCQVQSKLILARSKSKAAEELVKLTTSGNKEAARKACLDIINMSGVDDKSVVDSDKEKSGEEMAPELAGRVLAAMASAKRGGDGK